jgi:hypothetical protein
MDTRVKPAYDDGEERGNDDVGQRRVKPRMTAARKEQAGDYLRQHPAHTRKSRRAK